MSLVNYRLCLRTLTRGALLPPPLLFGFCVFTDEEPPLFDERRAVFFCALGPSLAMRILSSRAAFMLSSLLMWPHTPSSKS